MKEEFPAERLRECQVTTTLHHVRPLCPARQLLLRCCQEPQTFAALVASLDTNAATIVWLLADLMRHGLIRRIERPAQPIARRRGQPCRNA